MQFKDALDQALNELGQQIAPACEHPRESMHNMHIMRVNNNIGVQGKRRKKGVHPEQAIQDAMREVRALVDWHNLGFLHDLIKVNGVAVFKAVFAECRGDILKHRNEGRPFDTEAAILNAYFQDHLPAWPERRRK